MNDLGKQPTLRLPNNASELAEKLLHGEECGEVSMSDELLQKSYDAYCVPLYNVHERDEPAWPAVASTLGLFHVNRLLQKYQDHCDFVRFAQVWKSAESLIESVLREFESKGSCLSCASTYFWSCRHLGSILAFKCWDCVPEHEGLDGPATVELASLTEADRAKLMIVNKALEMCEIKHRCCQECMDQA